MNAPQLTAFEAAYPAAYRACVAAMSTLIFEAAYPAAHALRVQRVGLCDFEAAYPAAHVSTQGLKP